LKTAKSIVRYILDIFCQYRN